MQKEQDCTRKDEHAVEETVNSATKLCAGDLSAWVQIERRSLPVSPADCLDTRLLDSNFDRVNTTTTCKRSDQTNSNFDSVNNCNGKLAAATRSTQNCLRGFAVQRKKIELLPLQRIQQKGFCKNTFNTLRNR